LARDAATADVAATLIANAVNVESPAIRRRPARELDPDSDLRDLPVTVAVGALEPEDIEVALGRGLERAFDYRQRGLIVDAALMLQGRMRALGAGASHASLSPIAAGRAAARPALASDRNRQAART
jgi:hypothetical protein